MKNKKLFRVRKKISKGLIIFIIAMVVIVISAIIALKIAMDLYHYTFITILEHPLVQFLIVAFVATISVVLVNMYKNKLKGGS